jgi:RNA polymerase sigma-70 factor (ECF subfamily)
MVPGFQKSVPPLKPESGSLRTAVDGSWAQSNESDEGLMARFCDGDLPAFEILFQRYRQVIRAYLARLVGPVHADDLAQATFLSVVRARGRFDRKARFKPWLYAIATNAARDYLRRRREELTPTGELSSELADESGSEARDEGLEKAVQKALAQLPQSQRVAIVMHRFQNLSFAEVAQALDLSESAVKVRAHRGYKRLRELLRGLWDSR